MLVNISSTISEQEKIYNGDSLLALEDSKINCLEKILQFSTRIHNDDIGLDR